MDDLLADFLTETNESLADLDQALLRLERTPNDRETVSLVFRLVHTIKGTSGFLGLPELQSVAHAMENVLAELQDGTLTITPGRISQPRAALKRLEAVLANLSLASDEPQGERVNTCGPPVSQAWKQLPPLVSHLARSLGKEIELVTQGDDTRIDHTILRLLRNPLMHLVRNSCDHGLETPAGRRAAGKPETGRIMLNAWHEGGHVLIEIADDGNGLKLDRIRARTLASGRVKSAELSAMTDTQIQRFIFDAGFSTAPILTVISGRGVGLDVVKTTIGHLGGTVGLRTTPGQGTVFTLRIPLLQHGVPALARAAV